MNDGPGVVRAYKLLTRVERAFRAFRAVDLEIVATPTPLQARALAFLGLTPASVQAELRSLGHAQLTGIPQLELARVPMDRPWP